MNDSISRQAVIETAENVAFAVDEHGSAEGWLAMLVNSLEILPSTQPENDWIPISERLPEANGRYLVTRGLNACGSLWNRIYIANYSDLMGIKSVKIWWQGNVGKSDFEQLDDVLAWMPLPKPYREDDNEKQT